MWVFIHVQVLQGIVNNSVLGSGSERLGEEMGSGSKRPTCLSAIREVLGQSQVPK